MLYLIETAVRVLKGRQKGRRHQVVSVTEVLRFIIHIHI